MTNLVDSTAQFESRLKEIGLNPAFIDQVKGQGVQTLSQLGFAVGQPGQPIQNGDVDNFLGGALGRPLRSMRQLASRGQPSRHTP